MPLTAFLFTFGACADCHFEKSELSSLESSWLMHREAVRVEPAAGLALVEIEAGTVAEGVGDGVRVEVAESLRRRNGNQ